jgi:glutaryl-CoA dehydrogenase (non-decarboxylating)
MSVHTGLNSLTLLTWGSEEHKQKYLVPQAKGEKLATYGLTEPGAGSDVVGSRSTARRDGDEYVLNGEKMWISLADTADNFLFFCWTDEEKRRNRDHSGMSCFIVERGMKGFTSGTIHGKLGIRAGNTGYFSLQDTRVPKENLVGNEGEGFKIAMFALEQGRYTVAAGATGVIRASRDASVSYALERETFGTKIANHQLVKQKIAEMESDYQMTHLLWLRAGYLKNTGQANARATSGANGYSNDYPVERYWRNCKAAIIYEGTRDIHTLMQADWALGLKKEKPARRTLPPWKPAESTETASA